MSKIHPTIVTILASIASIFFFVLMVNGAYLWALVAFLGTAFDAIDGFLARKYGTVTSFGGFLDSTLDRVSDFFIIAAFAFGGLVSWEAMTVLLGLSFLISYIRSRGELASGGNIKFNIGLIERTPRLVLLFAGLFAYMVFPSLELGGDNVIEVTFFILIVLSLITIVQRILHAQRTL